MNNNGLTLMMGVLRRYRLAVRPTTSRHTPPPIAMIGSLRLHDNDATLLRPLQADQIKGTTP